MRDLGQEALDEMNRLLLNQERLKKKLERMGDNQIADLSKKIERLQEQLSEANEVIKYYAEKHGKLKACDYLNKWGVK